MQRAQTSLEYAVLIICIVLALLAINTYLKRSIQGKLRSAGDELGSQYDPKKTVSDMTTASSGNTITYVTSNTVNNVIITTSNTVIKLETDRRYGNETITD